MKGKQLLLLLVVVAALGGAWYYLSFRSGGGFSQSGGGGGKVVDFPVNDVAHLVIKDAKFEVNLVRKGDQWTVKERNDYPADYDKVSSVLRKLWELKTVQQVKVGPSQLPRLELVEPGKGDKTGTLVQFLSAEEKPLASLLLGKKHMRQSANDESDFGGGGGIPAGRYVKPVDSNNVSLVSEPLDDAQPHPAMWLLKDFFKVEGPKTVTVNGPTEAQRWSATRESTTADWTLADAKADEKIDVSKASFLSNVLGFPSFTDVLAPDAKLEEPVGSATIDTFDGFHYEFHIGKGTADNTPVTIKVSANFPKERTPGKDEKPDDKTRLDTEFATKQKQLEEKLAKEKALEGRPYTVPKYSVDPLQKERSALLADKAAAPATSPAPGASNSAPTPPVTVPGAPGAPVPPMPAVALPSTLPPPGPKVMPNPVPPVPAPNAPPVPPAPMPPAAATPAKADEAKPEAPKPDAPKADAPKTEPGKAETPKAEASKPKPAKAEAPKAEMPKTQSAAPATPAGEPAKPEATQPVSPEAKPAPPAPESAKPAEAKSESPKAEPAKPEAPQPAPPKDEPAKPAASETAPAPGPAPGAEGAAASAPAPSAASAPVSVPPASPAPSAEKQSAPAATDNNPAPAAAAPDAPEPKPAPSGPAPESGSAAPAKDE